jgi:hypothetical protein
MTEQSIYTTYYFRDSNNSQLICQLTVRNLQNKMDRVRLTLKELAEKYCLPEQEILVEE